MNVRRVRPDMIYGPTHPPQSLNLKLRYTLITRLLQ